MSALLVRVRACSILLCALALALPAVASGQPNSPGPLLSEKLTAEVDLSAISGLPVEVTQLADGLGTLVVPKSYIVLRTTEPEHGWEFAKSLYVYRPVKAGDPARLHLFCQVHYTTPDDQALAIRTARLLALAAQTLTSMTGRAPANGDTPFHVWLCQKGKSGGEQWRDNLYFYDLDSPRSSIEWIREIVHEYAHLALPAIGGYQEPEYWANGYLGERLIIRWFERMPDGPAKVERAWGDFSGAPNFNRLLIAPAIALYKRVGPSDKWLKQTDSSGMRYLIGDVLAFEDRYGGHQLGEVFGDLPRFRETKAADMRDALAEATPQHAARRSATR